MDKTYSVTMVVTLQVEAQTFEDADSLAISAISRLGGDVDSLVHTIEEDDDE